jgi:hypothetical protein
MSEGELMFFFHRGVRATKCVLATIFLSRRPISINCQKELVTYTRLHISATALVQIVRQIEMLGRRDIYGRVTGVSAIMSREIRGNRSPSQEDGLRG